MGGISVRYYSSVMNLWKTAVFKMPNFLYFLMTFIPQLILRRHFIRKQYAECVDSVDSTSHQTLGNDYISFSSGLTMLPPLKFIIN